MKNVYIETERLLISDLSINDKEDYFINISHDKKVLETFICAYCENIECFDFDKYLNREDLFAIRLKESNKLIGIVTIFKDDNGTTELGYGIGSSYWNNGYVTEAIKSFIKYVFDHTEITTLYASYFVGNNASKRVMEKAGMKESHFVEKELEYLGKWRDLVYYKIEK